MATQPTSSLTDLILSMEEAILAAKQLPYTSGDPTRIHQIQSSLHLAHSQLSSFLLSAAPLLPPAEDHSLEPMQLEEDESSIKTVDGVEERMRNCFIRNKRPKRRLSPSAAVDEKRRSGEDDLSGGGGGGGGFDPYAARLRALELVYQFHV